MREVSYISKLGKWTLRVRPGKSRRILVLLHGWTGDEDSMSIFMRGISDDFWLLAPRGLYTAVPNGYSWQTPVSHGLGSNIDTFRPSVDDLIEFLDLWRLENKFEPGIVDIAGFSQGGALSLALSVLKPEQIGRVGILSGFAPDGIEDFLKPGTLEGKKYFITHGTNDDVVPISSALKIKKILENSGAELNYCQSDSGHKISAGCLKHLEKFYC